MAHDNSQDERGKLASAFEIRPVERIGVCLDAAKTVSGRWMDDTRDYDEEALKALLRELSEIESIFDGSEPEIQIRAKDEPGFLEHVSQELAEIKAQMVRVRLPTDPKKETTKDIDQPEIIQRHSKDNGAVDRLRRLILTGGDQIDTMRSVETLRQDLREVEQKLDSINEQISQLMKNVITPSSPLG